MENGNLMTKVTIGKARASYAHVFHPTSISPTDTNLKYSVTLIIPKSETGLIEKIRAAMKNAYTNGMQSKWGGKAPKKPYDPLKDGDAEKPDDEAYADSYYINASCKTKPGVNKVKGYATIDGKRKLQTEEITDESEFYSGCYVYATVNFFAFDAGANKGVACGLNNILKVEDGEPLGGRSSAESDFGDLSLPEEDMPFSPDNDPFGATAEDKCPY